MASFVKKISLAFVCFLVLCQTAAQEQVEQAPIPCVCVRFYLCPNNTLNRDGKGLIKARSTSPRPLCNRGFKCCPLEERDLPVTNSEQESSTPLGHENENWIDKLIQYIDSNLSVNKPTFNGSDSNGSDPSISDSTDPSGSDPSRSDSSDPSGFDSTVPAPSRPSELIEGAYSSKGSDPKGARPKEPDVSTVNTFVVSEDKPTAKANPAFIPKPGCGVKRIELKQRISFTSLNESVAHFAEFPWMLAILTNHNPKSLVFQCGASLIHKQVALTAAHCVDRFPVSSLRIRAGEWDFKTTDEPQPHQERSVSRVELFPFYNPNSAHLRHDIALLFLDSPFRTSSNVDTICLPEANTLFHGARCTVTGWGKDPADPQETYHNILHKVEVPVIPCAECENRLRPTKGYAFSIHPSFLCAGGESGKDSCKGDGGGPLICPTEEPNRWVQAGIVSWGFGCGTNDPAFYSDVSVHVGWIYRLLNEFEQIPTDHLPTVPHVHQPIQKLY